MAATRPTEAEERWAGMMIVANPRLAAGSALLVSPGAVALESVEYGEGSFTFRYAFDRSRAAAIRGLGR